MQASLKFYIARACAVVALVLIYSTTIIIARVAGFLIRNRKLQDGVFINGTFHNPNWFYAHVEPLVLSEHGRVSLVTDEKVGEYDSLDYYCPPPWANTLFTRAGAKMLWTFWYGLKSRANVYVGYHIFPSAVIALICARLTGAKAVYQVTSGPLELEGGGWNAENRLMVMLGKPSRLVEALALAVTREFDLVIVRGSRAEKYVRDAGYRNALEIVTGSVIAPASIDHGNREYDVIFVGRLTEYKRPDRLIEVLAKVAERNTSFNAILVGEGPDRAELEARVSELGLESNIHFLGQRKDVPALMAKSKLFVLTSRWEGVSIAMLEAMSQGTVPIVSDVGDLRDFIRIGETGYILQEDENHDFANHIADLLDDESSRVRMAENARNLILDTCTRPLLSSRWREVFVSLTSKS